MIIQIGDAFPDITLKVMTDDGMDEIETGSLMAGKKSVLFALPGAFTPTCSSSHLPGYMRHRDAFLSKGVDQIVCLSVNDPFVMHAWCKKQNVNSEIIMLPDGNGELTAMMGLEMDGTPFGLGTRSERYAMVIDDGKISHLWVEEPGAFEVSMAEYVLERI